jgi:hypothetical protein
LVRAGVREMNDEDEWLNAGCAMIANTPPDLKPMAALLRTFEKPIPDGLRDLLADLLDPGDPPRHNARLKLEFISAEFSTANKEAAFYEKWIAVDAYDRLRAEGMSEEDALTKLANDKIFLREKSVFHKARQFIHAYIPTYIPEMLKRIRGG